MKNFLSTKARWGFYLLIAVLTTLYIYSISNNSLMYGDDLRFHLSRAYELAQHNLQFSFINTYTFGSLGNMITAFYPTFLLYPLAAMLWLTHNFVLSSFLFIFIINLGTLFIADYSFSRFFTKGKWLNLGAFVFTILYYFSNYRMNNIYVRFDLGELIAQAFLPAVLSGLLLLIDNKNSRLNWLLIFGFTGVALSHLLSTILVVLTSVIILFVHFVRLIYKRHNNMLELRNFTVAVFKNFGLLLVMTSITWLPLVSHMLVLHDTLTLSFDQGQVYRSLDIPTLIYHNVNGSFAYNGFLLLLLVMTPIIILLSKKTPFWSKSLSVFTIMLLVVQTTIFPLDKLAFFFAKKLQFSWRFNELYTLLIIWLSCWFLFIYLPQSQWIKLNNPLKSKKQFIGTLTTILFILMSINVVNHWYSFHVNYANTLNNPTTMRKRLDNNNLHDELMVQPYVLDYLPERTKPVTKLIKQHMIVSTNDINLSKGQLTEHNTKMTVDSNRLSFEIDDANNKNDYLFLPIIAYNHNYQVLVNGKETTFEINQEHVPYIKVPDTNKVNISIKYIPAWYDILGQLLFVISLIGSCIIAIKNRI